MIKTSFLSKNTEETVKAGESFGKTLKPFDIILFKGEMGAGKTHFIKGVGKALGIEDEIVSPTFALVNEYYGEIPLFHFDLFRINNFDDLFAIGFFDYPERSGVIAAEWSENIPFLKEELEKELKNNGGSGFIVEILKKGGETRLINIGSIVNDS